MKQALSTLNIVGIIALLIYSLNITEAQTLREIVTEKFPEGNFHIGSAAHYSTFSKNPALFTLLDQEFEYITPANDFKETTVHPDPETWEWTTANILLKHALENKQVIRVHGPISPQCSAWAKDDSRTSEELKRNLTEYMSALAHLCEENKQVRWMDVVNETISADGSWFGPKPGNDKWENPWTLLGFDTDANSTPLYIKEAFTIANTFAPHVPQIINQHVLSDTAVAKLKSLVLYLQSNGLRVDGIGWQAHIETGWEKDADNIRLLHDLISWTHAHKLSFHITECEVYLLNKKESPSNWNTHPISVDPEELETRYPAQAETYAALVQALLTHQRTGLLTLNVWHLIGSEAKFNREGSLFNEDLSPRPAYYAVKKTLLENSHH